MTENYASYADYDMSSPEPIAYSTALELAWQADAEVREARYLLEQAQETAREAWWVANNASYCDHPDTTGVQCERCGEFAYTLEQAEFDDFYRVLTSDISDLHLANLAR